MLRVWADRQPAGHLGRHGPRGTAFAYEPRVGARRAVSITMPVRTASWNTQHGLAPIFDMNLPEGALRAYLVRSFAKATGTFDDLDLLAVVGRTQIGRIRYSDLDAELNEDVPFQSIDEILSAKRGGELFAFLLEKFAVHSGLSGIQPKVMIRAVDDAGKGTGDRQSQSFRSATHIVKFWDPSEYPELAANEHFCLSAAKAMGLTVPNFQLSDSGAAILIQRFDLGPDGAYLGCEDFCVLNGVPSTDKYNGGYETRLFRRARDFIDPAERRRALGDLFKLFVLNCALRNGDAHLKNFGVIYEDVTGPARLAPVYDLVSTVPYLPKDGMALTLNGSTDWPDRKALVRLGQTRCDLSVQAISEIIEQAADVLAQLAPEVTKYFNENSVHREIGGRLLAAWQTGIRQSLGFPRAALV
ncbi:type II toxin-antitoxin system HipA family toxin [Bradyrhizobium sp.]|uniref:type II toxin-antitoxin system HipA family toxin n=1 Tax=Bradyrhizobium sp. TaxID=376 RepID=UPI004037D338